MNVSKTIPQTIFKKVLYTCNSRVLALCLLCTLSVTVFAGLLNFFVVVYLNTNFRLNGGGESSLRGLKIISSFLLMNLQNKGIVILVMNPAGNRKDLLFV